VGFRRQHAVECAATSASTAVSNASLLPKREGISVRKVPYDQTRLNLRSVDHLIALMSPLARTISWLAGDACTDPGMMGPEVRDAIEVPSSSLNLYLCVPAPMHGTFSLKHREQEGFV
jgi:hypothetical protein